MKSAPVVSLLLLLGIAVLPSARADEMHVKVSEFYLKRDGKAAEPTWVLSKKSRLWKVKGKPNKKYEGDTDFGDVEAALTLNEDLRFTATRTLRGRIVIDISASDGSHQSHWQDDEFSDFFGVSYTFTGSKGICRVEILVWTSPRDEGAEDK